MSNKNNTSSGGRIISIYTTYKLFLTYYNVVEVDVGRKCMQQNSVFLFSHDPSDLSWDHWRGPDAEVAKLPTVYTVK